MPQRLLSFSAVMLFIGMTLNAQVNTPAGATWPFGSRIQQFPSPYPYGLIPTNLPTGAYTPGSNLYGKSQDAYLAYVEWKACYIYDCGTESRVRFDNASETVSEGIGYGMLLAAYAADRNLVEELWRYYINRRNTRGFMNWKINNGGASACATTATGTNGATDSEVDVAMALVVAACQWPTYTFSGTNGTASGTAAGRTFAQEATYMISQIRQYEIIGSSCAALTQYLTSSGDGFVTGCNDCFNPSYQAPGYYRLWQGYDAGAPVGFWTTSVPNANYTLLNANRNTTTGLVSNWCNKSGTANTCNAPAYLDHGYDAGRNPWRMAVDYIWNGTAAANTNFTQPITNWLYTKSSSLTAPNNLRGPVDLNGAFNGRTNASPDAFFTSMWGSAALGVTAGGNNQAVLDYMYNRVRSVKQGNFGSDCTSGSTYYFGNTLRVITLFMMSGNFWKPCPPRCAAPLFASDSVSTCGPTSVSLNSALGTGGTRTFQWFKDNVSLGAASGSANTLTVNASTPAPAGPGWFKVKVDTVNGSTCTQYDSIYVSSSAIRPSLGANKVLCQSTSVTLSSGLYITTGYTFQWQYAADGNYSSLATLTGETASTLANVTKAGLYKVSAIKAGCTSLWDTMRISSPIIYPGDNCITASSGTVALSVTGPNLGPASQYDWYAAASGGSPLTTGSPNPATGTINWTTPTLTTGTYTYYVQDKSRQYGGIGKVAPTSPPANCSGTPPADNTSSGFGVDNGNVYSQDWKVIRTINIDSVTVWFCQWNSTLPTVTFVLTDATGASTLQTAAARPGIRVVNPGGSFASGLYQGIRYYVGFTNVAAGDYRIKISTPTAGLNAMWEQSMTNVFYNYYDDIDGNTAYIKSAFGYASTYSYRYVHFYDWVISTVNNCARVPVKAFVGSCPAGLPMELVSFEGKSYTSFNQLNWVTASEQHADYYLIQRSQEDGDFETIGSVKASGTKESVSEYQYLDRSMQDQGYYYRLELHDADGSTHYSPLIFVSRSKGSVSLFPNPATSELTIRIADELEDLPSISIVTSMGQVVHSSALSGNEKIINIAELSEGIYFVLVKYNNKVETLRLIKR